MRFPPEFMERLRNHSPISQVIGKRIPIKRHGREFHALCPFHKEKTASFTINDEKSFFHCFGCGAHGDAIGFVKDFENLSYVEAVERLANEFSIPIPRMTQESEEFERKRHTIEDTVALAAEWFTKQLQSPAGIQVREYLKDRGVLPATIEKFGLGYATPGRDDLKNALLQKGISEAMLIEAGLLAKSDDGSTYNRFRDRLIFPIRNYKGKVVAFGGRLLPSSGTREAAKYLNSPETPIFKKGEMLFAYDAALKEARDTQKIIVAEGYMDVIALHQAGITNAVAPLGTAITESQLRLLWRIAPEPILCLDGDEAGKRAMMRAADLALPLLKPGYSLRFAMLPRGEDPDSLLKKSGILVMHQILNQAKILSHVLWENAFMLYGSETAEKCASLEQHLMNLAEAVKDNIIKQHLRNYFREQIYALKGTKKPSKLMAQDVRLSALPDPSDTVSHIAQLEEQTVTLVMLNPGILHHIDIEEHFVAMDLAQPLLDKLRSAVLEITAATQSIDHAGLCAALYERGFSEKVKTLLHSNSNNLQTRLRTEIMENPQIAMQAFESAYSAYVDKKLEHEIKMAVGAFEREMSEENQSKLFALQKQRDELHRARFVITSENT